MSKQIEFESKLLDGDSDKRSLKVLPASEAFSNPKFVLAVNPNAWTLERIEETGDWKWLPRLMIYKMLPGVNGVTNRASSPDAGIDHSFTQNIIAQGNIIIGNKDSRLSTFLKKTKGVFIRETACAKPKYSITTSKFYAYHPIWMKPVMLVDGRIEWKVDNSLRQKFAYACATNILEMTHPQKHVITKVLEREVKTLTEIEKTPDAYVENTQSYKRRQAQLNKIETINKSIEGLTWKNDSDIEFESDFWDDHTQIESQEQLVETVVDTTASKRGKKSGV